MSRVTSTTLQTLITSVVIAGVCLAVQTVAKAQFSTSIGASDFRPVRELVTAGTIRAQIVEKTVFDDRTDVEVVLTDGQGRTLGGYAPPYLPADQHVQSLWRDYVATDLGMPATDVRLHVREERRSVNESFAVAFVLDHSPSMTMPRAIRMQRAVQRALTNFDGNDYVTVVKFTSRIVTEVPASNDKAEYLPAFKVNGLNVRSDGTAIYDATLRALAELSSVPASSKRIVVVFTDGEDNSSTSSIDDVIEAAKEVDARVFAVTYGVTNDASLSTLATETGGRIRHLNDVYDFDQVFLGIYNGLRHSYIVSVDNDEPSKEETSRGAITTLAMVGSGSINASELIPMMPHGHDALVPSMTSDVQLAVQYDLSYLESADLHPSDLGIIDSVATMMIQRSDLAIDILAPTVNGGSDSSAQRRLQRVKELLVRRGVHPSRVQERLRADLSQKHVAYNADRHPTTMVFTRR